MRGAAKLIGAPLLQQEVQAGTPRILGPLDLFAIWAVALHVHLLQPNYISRPNTVKDGHRRTHPLAFTLCR